MTLLLCFIYGIGCSSPTTPSSTTADECRHDNCVDKILSSFPVADPIAFSADCLGQKVVVHVSDTGISFQSNETDLRWRWDELTIAPTFSPVIDELWTAAENESAANQGLGHPTCLSGRQLFVTVIYHEPINHERYQLVTRSILFHSLAWVNIRSSEDYSPDSPLKSN
ncbi:MAG: hypothetical protein H6739_37105 [Alphaproteobacteria bacterium]|nr:hypothetical protein [Alphaproteobacteria bacterium]